MYKASGPTTKAVLLAAGFMITSAVLIICLGGASVLAQNAATQPATKTPASTRPAATQPAHANTRVYQIEGMYCQMCAGKIQQSLSALPGVKSAKVSFDEKKACVTVASQDAPSDARIQSVVEEAGYKAAPAMR